MAKQGEKKTVELNGKKYPVQHPGIRWFIKHMDKCKSPSGVLQNEKYIDGLLENVVLEKVKMEDFESLEDLNKLVTEIESFLGA